MPLPIKKDYPTAGSPGSIGKTRGPRVSDLDATSTRGWSIGAGMNAESNSKTTLAMIMAMSSFLNSSDLGIRLAFSPRSGGGALIPRPF